jgi:hypothetical protein
MPSAGRIAEIGELCEGWSRHGFSKRSSPQGSRASKRSRQWGDRTGGDRAVKAKEESGGVDAINRDPHGLHLAHRVGVAFLLFPDVFEQRRNDRAGFSERGERLCCGWTYFVGRVVRLDQGTGRRGQDCRGVIDGALGLG